MSELPLRGGTVHTLDDERTVTDAVLFRDGRVAALGDDAGDAAGDAETIDRTVLGGDVVYDGR